MKSYQYRLMPMSFTLEMSHSGMVEPGGEKETMPKSMPKGGGSRPKRSASTEGCNSMAELLPNRFDSLAIYRRKKVRRIPWSLPLISSS